MDTVWPSGETSEETILYNILALLVLLVLFRLQVLTRLEGGVSVFLREVSRPVYGEPQILGFKGTSRGMGNSWGPFEEPKLGSHWVPLTCMTGLWCKRSEPIRRHSTAPLSVESDPKPLLKRNQQELTWLVATVLKTQATFSKRPETKGGGLNSSCVNHGFNKEQPCCVWLTV